MRFNEFDTHNNLETKLKHFFEGKISSKDFSSYIKENQITEADLLEGPFSAIFKNAPKVWNRFKDAFRGSKQGELPLKGGSNTRPSAPAAAPKPPAAAPKTKPSNVGKVAGGAALGAAGTAAVLGTDGDAGPDKAQAAAPKPSGNMDDSSFGKAFAAARKQQGGPGGVFTWRGKKYQTNVKGEKYAKNPTAVSFGAPKPAAPSTPIQTGGAGGEFATSKPAANTTGEITGYSAQQADTVNKMIKKRQAARRGSTRGQSRLSGSTQSRDI